MALSDLKYYVFLFRKPFGSGFIQQKMQIQKKIVV